MSTTATNTDPVDLVPRVHVTVNISSSEQWEADLMDAADEYGAANVDITITNPLDDMDVDLWLVELQNWLRGKNTQCPPKSDSEEDKTAY